MPLRNLSIRLDDPTSAWDRWLDPGSLQPALERRLVALLSWVRTHGGTPVHNTITLFPNGAIVLSVERKSA